MPLLLLGKRKVQPPRLTSTFSTAFTATPTRHCSSKRRSSKDSASAGSFTSAGGAQWQRGYGSPSPGRQTPEQVLSSPPAPQKPLTPSADLGIGQRVRPRHDENGARPTHNAQGASGRSKSRNRASGSQSFGTIGLLQEGRDQDNPPAPSTPSRRAEISSVNDSSNSSSSSDNTATPKMTVTVQAAASATGACLRSQGRRRGACSISVSPPNSRADVRSPNHGAGLPERTHEVPITGLNFE